MRESEKKKLKATLLPAERPADIVEAQKYDATKAISDVALTQHIRESYRFAEGSEYLEMSDDDLARLDEIETAALEFIQVLADTDVEYTASLVYPIIDHATELLVEHGLDAHIPTVVHNEDGTAEFHSTIDETVI